MLADDCVLETTTRPKNAPIQIRLTASCRFVTFTSLRAASSLQDRGGHVTSSSIRPAPHACGWQSACTYRHAPRPSRSVTDKNRCGLPIVSGSRGSHRPLSTRLQRLVFGAPLPCQRPLTTNRPVAVVPLSRTRPRSLSLSFCTRHAPAHLLTPTARRPTTADMWRRVYFLLILVRVYFALSPSYLHPDENFQGPEVIAGECEHAADIPPSR